MLRVTKAVLIGSAATTVLSGCATVGDLDSAPPKISYETEKSPGELEECISIALASAGTPTAIRGDERRILDFNSGGITLWTITIYESSPTRAEMRWNGPLAGKWRNRFRECA